MAHVSLLLQAAEAQEEALRTAAKPMSLLPVTAVPAELLEDDRALMQWAGVDWSLPPKKAWRALAIAVHPDKHPGMRDAYTPLSQQVW